MATWIDFKELRSQLRFADVLRHYKVELKLKGDHGAASARSLAIRASGKGRSGRRPSLFT